MYPVLEVTDRDGWRKEFPLQRSLVMVGSHPSNHIALPDSRGRGIEARHLQLMLNPQEPGTVRIVNMSRAAVEIVSNGQSITLASSKMQVIGTNSSIKIGDFTLRLSDSGGTGYATGGSNGHLVESPSFAVQVPAQAGRGNLATVTQTQKPQPGAPIPPAGYGSTTIGLTVRMTQPTLTPTSPAEALVTVSNRGEKTAVQIRLQIEGLPAECYEVPPLPLLFPSAEKSMTITFAHPSTTLVAGSHNLRFIAVAPEAYPGEQTIVNQSVTIPALFSHEVTLEGPSN